MLMEPVKPLRRFQVDRLTVQIYEDRESLGRAAAAAVGQLWRQLPGSGPVRMIFAAAPSQNEFLAHLQKQPEVDWGRVVAFHLDEYLGLPASAPQSFHTYLRSHLFDTVHPGTIHWLNGETTVPAAECARYGALLDAAPLDIACVGVGENGHLAFNDPPVADFEDPYTVKVVELDPKDRQQQVNDGCFPSLDAVPRQALTVTIPPLIRSRAIVCVVPGERKAVAIRSLLTGPIDTSCPASILRRHPQAVLFLDQASASALA
ncbi:MAG: glucosamine-6-phosphate deaminase [Limnochordaceae bacterium]|nr:glucosamine-6-phosphate deaminase [Limnochordaceae bacterium]